MNFNYKKYSLEKLEEWMHDAMSNGEATPQDIYDVIKGVVEENYYYHKHHTSQAYELLALLNGNGSELYDAVMREKEYYESSDNYYPEEYRSSTGSGLQYTEEELNAMCDKAESEHIHDRKDKNGVTYLEYVKAKIEINSAWNDGWTKEYYQKIVDKYEGNKEKTLNYDQAVAAGWTMTDDGFWMPPQKEDKVVKWQLPVQIDDAASDTEPVYYVNFPDDLLEAANLKEGDSIEWIDNKDGSATLRKIIKSTEMGQSNGTV